MLGNFLLGPKQLLYRPTCTAGGWGGSIEPVEPPRYGPEVFSTVTNWHHTNISTSKTTQYYGHLKTSASPERATGRPNNAHWQSWLVRQHGLKTPTVSSVSLLWAIPVQSTDKQWSLTAVKVIFHNFIICFSVNLVRNGGTNHQSWWDKRYNWWDICPTSYTVKICPGQCTTVLNAVVQNWYMTL